MQTLTIFGPISEATSTQVLADLATLDRNQPLTVQINSDGGSVQAGVAIFSALLGWPGGLTTEVSGWALSVASVILMAGSVRRVHATGLVMVHAPWTGGASGNAKTLRNAADLLDRVAETLKAAYRRTGQSEAVIAGWLDGTDHWFTADEALSAGLVTEVATAEETAPEFANAMASAIRIPLHIVSRINAMTTPTAPTRAAIEAAAVQAEAQRRSGIRLMGQPFMSYEGMPSFLAALEDDTTVTPAQAGQRILAQLGRGAEPIAGGARPYLPGENRLTEFKAAATDVLLMRAGIKVADPHPATRDLQRMGIVAMAESILSMSGADLRDRSSAGVIQAAFATDDFPALLGNTANKALALGYETAPVGHTLFTGERDVRDFKPQTLINLSEAPDLDDVPELGEYKSGTMRDSATTFQLSTSGKILEISRQALINDDLGALTSVPAAMGMAARRMEADKVFAMLTANPNMRDGVPLFHADHGNLSAVAALSLQSLALARAAMRKQKGINGLGYLDPQPRFLIVPVALETLAEQLIASIVDPSKGNDTPNLQFIRNLTLVSDPRLDAVSDKAWYLAASPNQIDGILRVYLDGQRQPTIIENAEFKRDVYGYKVRHDFGVGVIDHRALHMNPGA